MSKINIYTGERLYSQSDLADMAYIQKEFGVKSKALWALDHGAYQGKEAAKYGYDPTDAQDVADYKADRMKYAIKGHFTPITATVIKRKAAKMAKEGKSPKEIRKYLEDHNYARTLGGLAEMSSTKAANVASGVLGYKAAKKYLTTGKLGASGKAQMAGALAIAGAKPLAKKAIKYTTLIDKLDKNRAWDKKYKKGYYKVEED